MQWRKSPQYANMPHEQYMQTDEGRQSAQAFQRWSQTTNQRAQAAGAPSQPAPPKPASQNYSAYSPGRAQPQQSPYANSYSYGQQPDAMSAWAMPKQQLLQWGAQQPQPQPLVPQQGMTPGQSWNAVSNVIGQVNNTAANQQVGTYLGEGAPPPGWGQTSYNPQQMWGQANQAVQQGYQNPFAPQPMPQAPGGPMPSPQDPAGNIRNLISASPPSQPGQARQPLYLAPGLQRDDLSMQPVPPPSQPGRDSKEYLDYRRTVVTDRRYRTPEESAAMEQRIYDGWLRKRQGGGDQSDFGPMPAPPLPTSPPLPSEPPAPPLPTWPPPRDSGWQKYIDSYNEKLRSGDPRRADEYRKKIDWAQRSQRREEEYLAASEGYDIGSAASAAKLKLAEERWQREDSLRRQQQASPSPPPPPPARRQPPRSPFPPGVHVALPPALQGQQWVRQLDGSYGLPSAGTPRRWTQPRVTNYGQMTPEEIAATPSPYLGGRRPTVRTFGGGG